MGRELKNVKNKKPLVNTVRAFALGLGLAFYLQENRVGVAESNIEKGALYYIDFGYTDSHVFYVF